jgi:glycosyltransferase involved in cell wall biosynthesis
MVVRDEAELLKKSLQSCADAFDEIILVDTGRADHAEKIAARYKAKVFPLKWAGDYAAARNFSFSKATCDYVMWLDEDEFLLPGDVYQLRLLKKALPRSADIVMMKSSVGPTVGCRSGLTYYRERMFRRSAKFQWQERAHEYIQLAGRVVSADVVVTHTEQEFVHAGDYLAIYRQMAQSGETFTPRSQLYFARELRDGGFINESVLKYERYVALEDGWIDDYLSACFELSLLYQRLHDNEKMVAVLLASLKNSHPKPEICCQLGEYHYGQKAYTEALYWYDQALKPHNDGWGYAYADYRGYLPALQSCLCYYNLGDVENAVKCNALAKTFKPDDPSVLTNERFFAGLKKK